LKINKPEGEIMMRKNAFAITLAAFGGCLTLAPLAPVYAQAAAAATAAHYSVKDTLVGKLLDDPAASAILQKHIPTIYANPMFKDAGRELTLTAIQQYEPDALSDANLAKIQADFDKIPAKG
jgi:hypothetical protein